MKTSASATKYLCLGVLLIFQLCIYQALAQTVVKGKVLDHKKQPLLFANVYARINDTSAIIAMTTTNNLGAFRLQLTNQTNVIVTASILGYHSQHKRIKLSASTLETDSLHFILTPKDVSLKEVVVRAKVPIHKTKDTITYNVDAFRDSTERNLEELLEKLPGVNIDKEKGEIKVMGKPIEKILIEGDDLTGKNYQLLSKNLSANIIDKIQVVDKFSNNKLLKGIKNSDKQVLNLILKDETKGVLSGNINLGFGNDQRRRLGINLIGIFKKFKSISFGKHNTIGQTDWAEQSLDQDFWSKSEAQEQNLVTYQNQPSIRLSSGASSSRYTRFNNATLLSSNFVAKPSQAFRLKGGVSFNKDQQQYFSTSLLTYNLSDSVVSINENNALTSSPEILNTRLEAELSIGKKSMIRFLGALKTNTTQRQQHTILNDNMIDNQLNEQQFLTNNTLDFTYRFNDHTAFISSLTYYKDTQQQNLAIQQTLPRNVLLVPTSFTTSDQLNDQLAEVVSLNSFLHLSKQPYKVSLGAGAVRKVENLTSNFFLDDTTQENPDFTNNLSLTTTNYYLKGFYNKQFNNNVFFVESTLGYLTVSQNNILLNKQQNLKELFYYLPVLGLRIKRNQASFTSSYAFNYQLPQQIEITSGYILSDYRQLERGSNEYIPANSHTILLNYYFSNYANDYLVYFNLVGTHTARGYQLFNTVSSDFNILSRQPNNFNNQQVSFSSGVEKYLPAISSGLKLRPRVTVSQSQNALNDGITRTNLFFNSSLNASLRTAFSQKITFHLGTTLTYRHITTTTEREESKIENRSIGAFFDVYFKPFKKFNGKLTSEYFSANQAGQPTQRYLFLNGRLGYRMFKGKLDLNVVLHNILNTQNFNNILVTDSFVSTNSSRIIPRYFLLEVLYRF